MKKIRGTKKSLKLISKIGEPILKSRITFKNLIAQNCMYIDQ